MPIGVLSSYDCWQSYYVEIFCSYNFMYWDIYRSMTKYPVFYNKTFEYGP